MPTVHLVCGSIGAGKTTYAKALTDRVRGARFSIDEWMATLFLAEPLEQLTLARAIERTARCETQMWSIADQLISRGLDVVFDVGLSKRAHRDRFRLHAAQVGAQSKLHYLDVDVEARRARVKQRNEQRTGTYAFDVTEAMFNFMESAFEVPTDDELYEGMIVCL